jgi:hypothetical protein
VDDAVVQVNDDSSIIIKKIIKRYQEKLTCRLDSLYGCDIRVDEAIEEAESLKKFALRLEPDFREELESLINKTMTDTCNALLQEYRDRLASLADEGGMGISGFKINPFQLMSGSHFSVEGISVNSLVRNKEVEDGREWVKNTSKKWYKPWTWFQESGYYRTKYKTVQFVKAEELAQDFLAPINNGLFSCGEEAKKFARKQSKNIADSFTKEFERLDDELKEKLDQLKSYATDKEQAEARIAETERRLKWLEQIKAKVESILEI